ncbi:MAG: hypothetical protein K8T20_01650 [Planctomycetes bacterium]|nr:hypothetical protein [Planctomycetota bacterium]
MNQVEMSEEEAVERLLRVIATRHAKRAAATPPDLNDPAAVVRWLEAAAKSAEEEFDQMMGLMPPATETRRLKLMKMMA